MSFTSEYGCIICTVAINKHNNGSQTEFQMCALIYNVLKVCH